MKKPKKPNFKKAPKMPKSTASKQTWDNYERKLNEIEAHNKKLTADYKKDLKKYDKEKQRREKIKAKAKSDLGRI